MFWNKIFVWIMSKNKFEYSYIMFCWIDVIIMYVLILCVNVCGLCVICGNKVFFCLWVYMCVIK